MCQVRFEILQFHHLGLQLADPVTPFMVGAIVCLAPEGRMLLHAENQAAPIVHKCSFHLGECACSSASMYSRTSKAPTTTSNSFS